MTEHRKAKSRALKIREYAEKNPDMTQMVIAKVFHVRQQVVSRALRGKVE